MFPSARSPESRGGDQQITVYGGISGYRQMSTGSVL